MGHGGAVEGLVDGFEVDAGSCCGAAVEDVDGDESCLGDEDGDLLGVHGPEEDEAAGGLTRLEGEVVVVVLDLVLDAVGGYPGPVGGQVQQAHPVGAPVEGLPQAGT